MLMVKDTLFKIIHKIPDGGMSAVGGIAKYAFYEPGCPEFADLEKKFVEGDLPQLQRALDIEGQPLPLLWTSDFIPKDVVKTVALADGETIAVAQPGATEYVVGEFNCSCVGISQLGKACGPDRDLSFVGDLDFAEATKLTDLMGKKAIEILNEDRAPTTAATSPTTNANKAESPGSAPPRAHSFAAYPAGTLLLSLLSAFASSL